MTRRPDYIERRIDFQIQRQRAKRTHPQPCDCPYCIAQDRVEELIRERLAANPGAGEAVPF
jgi:hypothetical protein